MYYKGKRVNKNMFLELIDKDLKVYTEDNFRREIKKFHETYVKENERKRRKKTKFENYVVAEKINDIHVIRYFKYTIINGLETSFYECVREFIGVQIDKNEKGNITATRGKYYCLGQYCFYFVNELEENTKWSLMNQSYYALNVDVVSSKIKFETYCKDFFRRLKPDERIDYLVKLIEEPKYEILYKLNYRNTNYSIEFFTNKQLYFIGKNNLDYPQAELVKRLNTYDLELLKMYKDDTTIIYSTIYKHHESSYERFVSKERFIRFLKSFKRPIDFALYEDYIRNLIDLDLLDYKHLCNKDFEKDHIIFVKQIAIRRDKVLEEKYKKKRLELEPLALKLKEKSDDLIYLLPDSVREFMYEANENHNCLYTNRYANKVIEGKCIIIFVRKKEEPEKPFIDVEITLNFKIRQCYQKYNQKPDKEITQKIQNVFNELRDETIYKKIINPNPRARQAQLQPQI